MTELGTVPAPGNRSPASRGPAFHERDIALSDVTLRVAFGPANGEPLVWIHGVGRSWHDAAPLLSGLMPCWSIVAPDLRGHGGSAHTPGKYLIRDFLGDITSLLEQIERPAVIYGHSLGAMLAALVAAACPERVRAVIAEDPPSPGYLERLEETPYAPLFRAMRGLAGTTRDVSAIARVLGDVVVRDDAGGRLRLRDIRDGASIRSQYDGCVISIPRFTRQSSNAAGATVSISLKSGRASSARRCCWQETKRSAACCRTTTRATS